MVDAQVHAVRNAARAGALKVAATRGNRRTARRGCLRHAAHPAGAGHGHGDGYRGGGSCGRRVSARVTSSAACVVVSVWFAVRVLALSPFIFFYSPCFSRLAWFCVVRG